MVRGPCLNGSGGMRPAERHTKTGPPPTVDLLKSLTHSVLFSEFFSFSLYRWCGWGACSSVSTGVKVVSK